MPQTTPLPATTPTAAEIQAARKWLEERVAALRADGVEPRDLDLVKLVAVLSLIRAQIEAHAADFAGEGVTAAMLAAVDAIGAELQALLKTLPNDYRKLRTLAQAQRDLVAAAYELLSRFTSLLDRRARGPKLTKAARELGLGIPRSHSLASLQAAYQTVVHGTQDAARCQLLGVDAKKIAALQAMQDKLLAAAPSASKKAVDGSKDILKVDQLQMALEVYFGEVGAVADWLLSGDARLQLVSLLPRTESGRAKKAAPVVQEPVAPAASAPAHAELVLDAESAQA